MHAHVVSITKVETIHRSIRLKLETNEVFVLTNDERQTVDEF